MLQSAPPHLRHFIVHLSLLEAMSYGNCCLVSDIPECAEVVEDKKKITIKTLLLFVPLVVTLAWNQIYYYFFSSVQGDSARYQLLINSFKVIKDHFPIGSGFGTYASYYSGKYYSPIYSSYGLTGIYGLTRDNTSFISDSFWPMVFAQTGLIGTVANVSSCMLCSARINNI